MNILYHLPSDFPDLARATAGSVGFDLRADEAVTIYSHRHAKIPTGLHLAMPIGVEAQIRGRSGLAAKGILSHTGTVDSDYRGPVSALLFNLSGEPLVIERGDRIAQVVFAPVLLPDLSTRRWHEVTGRLRTYSLKFRRVPSLDDLPASERGVGGFGSTGR